MAIATIGAFALGEYPEAVAVMLFYSVGEVFQTIAVSRAKGNIKAINPIHLLMHIMSLCIFPFVGRPVFMHVTGTDMSGFENLMEERKNIIADSVIQLIKK